MKILFLTTVLPNNKKTGGEIATQQYVKALRIKNEVHLLGYKRIDEKIQLEEDDYLVSERIIESENSKFWTIIWLILSLFSRRSYSSQKYISKKYTTMLKEKLIKNKYDLAIIDHSQLSWVINYLPNDLAIVFNSHNVEFEIYKELENQTNSKLKKILYKRESSFIKKEEIKLLTNSNQTWVLSDNDKKEYSLLSKSKIYVNNIPGGFNQLKNLDKIYDIGLLGTWTWESNKKGLEWFLKNIISKINPKYEIYIGGKGSLNYSNIYKNVQTLGFVDDAQDFLSSCRLLVIPTTAGGGIQIKTLDSISTNRPIVTTTIGVRGLNSIPNSVFIENDIDSFSNKINTLLEENIEFSSGFDWSRKRNKEFSENLDKYLEEINGKS